MQAKSWTGIAEITTAQCVAALKQIDGDDVDAIIQVGTNLSMVGLAAAAEMWLGKPVIAINTATYWHALRTRGFGEKFGGGAISHETSLLLLACGVAICRQQGRVGQARPLQFHLSHYSCHCCLSAV